MQSILHLYFSSEISKELKEIYNFFDSHFIISPGITGEPLASLYFNKYEDFDWEPYKGMKVFTQTIRNKKGSATDFNLEVEKVLVTDDIDLFHNKLTNTVLILNKSLKIASFYISEKSKYYIIDFIRDLIIKNEEKLGSLVLHAAGAVCNGKAIILVGAKGAGKTTYLYDLVVKHKLLFFSGDKIFIKVNIDNEKIDCYGWPDYPHIGFRTVLKYVRLKDHVEKLGFIIDENYLEQKILLPPTDLQEALGFSIVKGPVPIGSIIFPSIHPEMQTTLKKCNHIVENVLEHLEYTDDNPFKNWHQFIRSVNKDYQKQYLEILRMQLSSYPIYRIEGDGSLSFENIKELNLS